MSQAYLSKPITVAASTNGSKPRRARSNRKIDTLFGRAYRRFDRSKETKKLLQRYLIA